MRYLLIYLLLISCNQAQDKKQQTANLNATSKTDTIPSDKTDTLTVDTFSITSLIPEFAKDTNFHHISGISVGTDIQKTVIYSVYRLPRKKAFEILNKKTKHNIAPDKKQVSAYSNLIKVDTSYFFKAVYRDYEKNSTGQKFYNAIKLLNGYDIFFSLSYGYMHWLFFDKNSDTIYQRTQLLTF